jgi:FAD/FMN-containing dehydrogenase
MHGGEPDVAVSCRTTAEVVNAVKLARDRGLRVAVRGGGHSIAGLSTIDGGMLIDLAPMNGVEVDPERKIAKVGGGALWSDVDQATQQYGLATPGGVVSDTGVAGLTLGGGYGWLRRKFGLSCDNLLEAEVVCADGEVRTASADSHPDLYWALRGGGGNFGVVTSLEYRLHPVGPLVFAGPVFYGAADAAEVLRSWRDLTAAMPDELTTLANILVAPPVPFLPEAVHGQCGPWPNRSPI